MEHQELKIIMRANARLANGLVNLLKVDTEQLCTDVDKFDIFSLRKTIRETKNTAQALIDTVTELERDLRIAKRDA